MNIYDATEQAYENGYEDGVKERDNRSLTDNEIKKALERCTSDIPPCISCKYDADSITCDGCMGELMKDALDLIDRRDAEIERLEIELKAMRGAANSYKLECERLRKRLDIAETCIDEAEDASYRGGSNDYVDMAFEKYNKALKELTEVSDNA